MLKNAFGPFPDEPLLYGIDKIIGLCYKFTAKLQHAESKGRKDAENQIENIVIPVEQKSNDVVDKTETTAENNVAPVVMNEIGLDVSDNASHVSSPKSTTVAQGSNDVNEPNKSSAVPEYLNKNDEVKVVAEAPQQSFDTTPRPILKRSSSMECNYTLSKVAFANKSLQVERTPVAVLRKTNSCTKFSTKTYAQRKGFGDSVAIIQNTLERKLLRSDGRHRVGSILKKETKQEKVIVSSNTNVKRNERLNKAIQELTHSGRPQINKNVKLNHRKIVRKEWAVTRIYTFDDDSQTYEIMKKDKVLETSGGIERIFAISPNRTTVAYDPLKPKVRR